MTLQPNPVNWFEIPAADWRRARQFYESAFGVQLTISEMGPMKMASFPMEMGHAGAAGAVVHGPGYDPSSAGTRVYLHVPSIEPVLVRVENHGGTIVMPRTSIGKHGFMAHFLDSEGNRVALHESPASPSCCDSEEPATIMKKA